jgi:hypothetical protein
MDDFRYFSTICKWNNEFRRKNRKIVLLADNCPAHPHIQDLSNIKLVFLPPNATSVLQPMNMGIIKSIKGYCKRFFVLQLIDLRERGLHNNVSLLDSISLMKDAWDAVTPATVIDYFRKSGLSSAEFTVGDQNINEDALPLSEWLKQNGITNYDHLSDIDNFINADDDLMTSEIPTESDIIETILNREDIDEDNVEFVEDTIYKIRANLLAGSGCYRDFN